MMNGMDFELSSPCTVTLVKEDGKLLIAGFHVSASAFDNPIIDAILRKTLYWAGGVGLGSGACLGAIGMWLVSRIRKRAVSK